LEILVIIALALAIVHFGIPLSYYFIARRSWLPLPWGVKRDESYRPKVSIILPTYNEEKIIEKRLDNIFSQKYPRDLLELVIIDSSSDGTVEKIEDWYRRHEGFPLKLMHESERRGKAFALNEALKISTGEIAVIADADAFWEENALPEAISWLSDASVGAVTCLKRPMNDGSAKIEGSYRNYYNVMRLAESKKFSTPIFHGELAAFRKDLLEKIGGFPTDIGSDDSHTATMIAMNGYRSIAPEGVLCSERVPKKGYGEWRIRRAQHLVQHFSRMLSHIGKAPEGFRKILAIETYLHIFNPWLLIIAAGILVYGALEGSSLSAFLLGAGLLLLLYSPYRTWVATQLYLMMGAVRNIWTKEIAWEKQEK
jgi:cellulose synthase/poly-beta-1,6-N-acetylglucosamine synthase-like glycosyltransferase